ncbi:hypothetical protein ACFFX0_12055 [Citricoccus parietis]|uniref:Uncharacterized protein n=1 Tax=Citricoccus parietis TaxID=592307 RepID=A0ABV5FYY4_9MICC
MGSGRTRRLVSRLSCKASPRHGTRTGETSSPSRTRLRPATLIHTYSRATPRSTSPPRASARSPPCGASPPVIPSGP